MARMAHLERQVHGAELWTAKLAVRNAVLAARDGVDTAARASASNAIAERILALPSYRAAGAVLLTLPFRSEWDTRPIVQDALASGKTVALTRVDAAARMLLLHRVMSLDTDVATGYQGIPEPAPHCPVLAATAVDWVLVPGVAFDRVGRRLGYGGGYYDRLLPLLRADVPRIAGAYAMQIVPQVPAAPHDESIDALVTEHETLHFPRAG
jgi:5-formyltetrahydrofolate cyclo-ligase